LKQPPSNLRAVIILLESALGQSAEIAASLANENEELKGWSLALH